MDTNQTKPNTNDEAQAQIFNDAETELRARFELLPKELQEAILSSEYQTKLFEIAKKHKLTYDKLGQLEMETTMVLLGMTPPDEYKDDIAEQLELKGSELESVVHDINEEVFKPIRESLVKLYKKEEVEEGETINTKPNNISTSTKTDTYRESVGDTKKEVSNEQKEVVKPTTITPQPQKVIIPPTQKVEELKKQVAMATGITQTKTEPVTKEENTMLKSVEEQLKAIREKSKVPENITPQNQPKNSELNRAMIAPSLEETKSRDIPVQNTTGMSTMAQAISMAQSPVGAEKKKGLFGGLKKMFSTPKKPVDILVQKELPAPKKSSESPKIDGTQQGDPYREAL